VPFNFKRLAIHDVILIEPRVFPDERGFFMETYKYADFAAFGIEEQFAQDNHSRSTRGVLRGLHYQKPPKAQGKLVRVVVGEIFDVAVDIRSARGIARDGYTPQGKGSPTYGKWVGEVLSAENKRMLYIPPGFAHGFCVLSDVAEVTYKVTEEFSPEHDAGIIWNDPEIGIEWPIEQPIISPKDAALPSLHQVLGLGD
jgi:dTDP-4-dehydrorhamnose 3,5-epimerase